MLMLKFSNSNVWSVTIDFKWLMWVILNDVFDILRVLFMLHHPVMCMGGYLYNSFSLNGRIEFFVFKKYLESCSKDTKLSSENTKRKQDVSQSIKGNQTSVLEYGNYWECRWYT